MFDNTGYPSIDASFTELMLGNIPYSAKFWRGIFWQIRKQPPKFYTPKFIFCFLKMASLLKYVKFITKKGGDSSPPATLLPDPDSSLNKVIPSSAIAKANELVVPVYKHQ